jgi:glycosyltransferase involved in cell wall biosynthesis
MYFNKKIIKNILIIDLSFAGHHTVYLEKITSAYLHEGCKVTVATLQSNYNHSIFTKFETEFPEKFSSIFIPSDSWIEKLRPKIGNIGRELINWYIFKKVFYKLNNYNKIDYIFLPYVDCCLHSIGLLGSPFGDSNWGGICMQNTIHHERYGFGKIKSSNIKKYLFLRFLKCKNLTVLFTIDELLLKYLNEINHEIGSRIKFIADPGELKGNHTCQSARDAIGIPRSAVVILVFGDINIRKGIDILVKALSSSDTSSSFHLLIVGDQDDTVKLLFESVEIINLIKNKRIYIKNQFVNKDFQQLAFAAADIVWLGYRDHLSMSGVLVLSAIARKVVIATDAGIIGWYTREKCLGLTVNIKDVESIKYALKELAEPARLVNYRLRISNYFDSSTWENATSMILSETIDKFNL